MLNRVMGEPCFRFAAGGVFSSDEIFARFLLGVWLVVGRFSNVSAFRTLLNFLQLIRLSITVAVPFSSIDCWIVLFVNLTVGLISACRSWLEGFIINFDRGVSQMTS